MKRFAAVLLAILMTVTLFGCSAKPVEDETTTEATTETTTKAPVLNPFTGESGFSESAVGKRPVAIVVENLRPARPQWGITSPDIICEGEVEGGISRMLWLYADVNDVPEKVGPLRSARPSYVKFSTFFDAIFIHWGGSHSKSNYTGGYETIKKLKVNNIDGMSGGEMFSRDTTRNVSSEHRGVMNGKKLSNAIKKKGYRTELDNTKFTQLKFNTEISPAGATEAKTAKVKFSDRMDTRTFTYDTSDGKYHTNDWEKEVKFQNLIILKAESTYITVPYKGSTTTYLNYKWSSGSGTYVSNGTSTDITWEIKDGKLVLKDAVGNDLTINKGKSYIGFVSSNHNGKVTCSAE
ncbi:DUF3048 domain-containing protein [Eubacterium sp.]|uniref:DUF3048 domain-containing protein n=1 Tax=Eubacterium sp. TaxID=142586 RepID=UPI003F105233